MTKPKDILECLESRIGLTGTPRRLTEVIGEILIAEFSMSSMLAIERSESLVEPVSKLLRERESTKSTYALTLTGSNDQFVLGACCVLISDSPEIAAAKRGRTNTLPLLAAIKALNPTQFEQFGRQVLFLLGAADAHVTSLSNDQGIDFFGTWSMGQTTGLPPKYMRLAHDVTLRFAGQAKHYPNRAIQPNLIRELIGSIALARHHYFTAEYDPFEKLELSPFNPLLSMFFTTGWFSSGAKELADQVGIVAKSGDELAQFLADKKIGMKEQSGQFIFDSDLFQAWLAEDKLTEHA